MVNLFDFYAEPNAVDARAEEEQQAEAMDSDESDVEDAMETNDAEGDAEAVATETDAMDTEVSDSAKTKADKKSELKRAPPVVSSGLPQSKEELEDLISSIHRTVSQSVLPRLHKCLIAKVSAQVILNYPH